MGRRRRVSLIGMLVLLVVMSGCALTAKGKYLSASLAFKDNANELADYRDKLPPEEQEKMNEVAKPILASAKVALLAWGTALDSKQDPDAEIAAWKLIAAQVAKLITTYLGD